MRGGAELLTNGVDHHADGHVVMAAVGDNNIGPALGWLDKAVMHGAHRFKILGDNGVEIATAVFDVARQAADDALVAVGIDEDLDVELLADGLDAQDEDAFDDNCVAGIDRDGFLFAQAIDEAVFGLLDALARLEELEVAHHQLGVEGVRVVEIDLQPLLEAQVREVSVIGVLIDEGDATVLEAIADLARDRALSGRRPARDANDDGSVHGAAHLVQKSEVVNFASQPSAHGQKALFWGGFGGGLEGGFGAIFLAIAARGPARRRAP